MTRCQIFESRRVNVFENLNYHIGGVTRGWALYRVPIAATMVYSARGVLTACLPTPSLFAVCVSTREHLILYDHDYY